MTAPSIEPGAVGDDERHELSLVLLLDADSQTRRSTDSSRKAWARQAHLVEVRAWPDGLGANIVEALCGHTCLRAVFIGCDRSLRHHDAAEAALALATAVREHVARCPNPRPVQRRLVRL